MRKLPTLVDCTTFRFPDCGSYGLGATLLFQLGYYGYSDRVSVGAPFLCQTVTRIRSYLGSKPLLSSEQLHLSEFIAHRSRDMVLRLDLHTEARNTAAQQA